MPNTAQLILHLISNCLTPVALHKICPFQYPSEHTKLLGKPFFPLERRCNHDIRDKQEEIEYIIPWEGRFSESDIRVYSHECAVKGSETPLLSTWPLFPMQNILSTVIYRKYDNRYYFNECSVENSIVWMTEKASGTHSLPIVLSHTRTAVRGWIFFLNILGKNNLVTARLVFQFSGFPQTAKFASTIKTSKQGSPSRAQTCYSASKKSQCLIWLWLIWVAFLYRLCLYWQK